jgi:histone H3/H4
MHGVRALIEFVRADERATAEAATEGKHQSLKALYEALQASERDASERHRQRLTEKVEHMLRAYKALHDLALTARAAGRKTLKARDVIDAVGLDMNGWEDR